MKLCIVAITKCKLPVGTLLIADKSGFGNIDDNSKHFGLVVQGTLCYWPSYRNDAFVPYLAHDKYYKP
jgi:hypothetical protein